MRWSEIDYFLRMIFTNVSGQMQHQEGICMIFWPFLEEWLTSQNDMGISLPLLYPETLKLCSSHPCQRTVETVSCIQLKGKDEDVSCFEFVLHPLPDWAKLT